MHQMLAELRDYMDEQNLAYSLIYLDDMDHTFVHLVSRRGYTHEDFNKAIDDNKRVANETIEDMTVELPPVQEANAEQLNFIEIICMLMSMLGIRFFLVLPKWEDNALRLMRN